MICVVAVIGLLRSILSDVGTLGEVFCIIEQAELEMPQGSFRHELDYPWGLFSVLDVAVGKTDEQDELMNIALMPAKNNMKDDQNHALFCNQLTSSWENNFKRK